MDVGKCQHHEKKMGVDKWVAYDARGIAIGVVCDNCERAVKARYRPEIFTNSNYWTDEPVEED